MRVEFSALVEGELEALWAAYGPQEQQAWRDQLVHDQPPPEFDPDAPF